MTTHPASRHTVAPATVTRANGEALGAGGCSKSERRPAAGKTISKRHVDGPTGVRVRNSDNRLIREKLNWSPSTVLLDGCFQAWLILRGHPAQQGKELAIQLADRPFINQEAALL